MVKYISIFALGLLFGFSILFFRNVYEKNTSEIKSYWNLVELKEGDSKNFYDRGMALYSGNSYFYGCENAPIVAFFRPPVYPVFIALSFLVFGVSIKTIIILQIIIAAAIILLISKIAELIFGNIFSYISAVLAVLYYPMWNNAMIIDSELLSAFLGLLSLYFILKFYLAETSSWKFLLYSGIFVSLASLTRGQFFVYSMLFPIFIFSKKKLIFSQKFKYTSIWFSFCLIPILIWTFYAYFSSGLFVFISTQGAYSIWWGWSARVVMEQNYPLWNELWDKSPLVDDAIGTFLPAKSTFWFLSEAFNFIIKFPLDAIKIAFYKLLDSWGFIDIYIKTGFLSKILSVLKFNWDLFLSVPAVFILWKKKQNVVFVKYFVFAFLIYTVVSLLTAALVRYRIPYLDPLMIILSSYTVYSLYSYYTSKKNKKLNI